MSLEIAEHLATFVRARFRIPADDPRFDDCVHLFEEGYVDSTGFVELVAHIEERYRITLPDNALFSEEFTTIRGIAGVVAQLGGVEPTAAADDHVRSLERELAPMRELAPGLATPLVCLCGIGVYEPLAAALEGDGPVYAVDLPLDGVRGDGGAVVPSIEQIARAYVEAIRARRPAGPYRLAGWSYGGVVAYEVARQLTQAGERVDLVALFESDLPSARGGPRGAIPRPLAALLDRGARYARKQVSARAHWVRDVVAGSASAARSEIDPTRAEAMSRALERYEQTIAPYAGQVVLYRADADPENPDGGWRRVAKNLAVVLVPTVQTTILRGPAVETVARELRARTQTASAA